MLRIVLFFLLVTVLASCEKEGEVAVINYYISATATMSFDQIQFRFDHTRARRENEAETVYLDPLEVNLDLSNPADIFLGSSKISACRS